MKWGRFIDYSPMSFLRKIDIIFFISIIIFSGLFLLTFQSLKYTRESNQLVSHTQDVLYHLETVLSSTVAIETSSRGFIITGNEAYLDLLDSSRLEIEMEINRLKKLKQDNPDQLARLDSLSIFIEQKIAVSEYGISLRRGDRNRALDQVSTGKGKILMDQIRNMCRVLEEEELAMLNIQTSENERHVFAHYRNYLIFALFSLTFFFIFYNKIKENAGKLLEYRKRQDQLIKELNYQNRQLDDFAHITSHNIRSPASNISTLISLLNENSSIEEYQMIYEKLTKVSKNLNETLNELVDVLQIKKDIGIEKQILSFEEVYNKVKDSLQGEILKHQVIIRTDFSEAKQIEYPRTYLESVFHNLLSNAIKYRHKSRTPEIDVKTFEVDGDIVLRVADNGLGIDLKKYGAKIFGLRKIFHENKDAKGLGLFMTKSQIEAMGGSISVESEVGTGSVFTVRFNKKSALQDPESSTETILA